MAHPMSSRRIERRALLAAGTAAALLGAPALATPAHGASLLDGLAEDVPACTPDADADAARAADDACDEDDGGGGLLSGVTDALPGQLQGVVDPVEQVVDDVIGNLPAPVTDVVEDLPAVAGDVPGVVEDVTGGLTDVPSGPADVVPEEVPVPAVVSPEVGTASSPPVERTVSGPPQGPGLPRPPLAPRGVPADTTVTRPARPFIPPAVSAPLFGGLPRVAEEFLSRAPATTSDALAAMRGSQTTTVPGPDASSWLLATASGMLLLLGAGHVVHARHRYAASVAR